MSEEFPYINNDIENEELPIPCEYAWDFSLNKFIYDEFGRHKLVYKNEAIKVWIYKALQTERFQYLAYSWQYGIELKKFIGKVMQVQERYSELRRAIIECLMVNAYIRSIDSITFSVEENSRKLMCNIQVTTIYGEVELNV